jgi:arylsulfatase A-like enzyme
MFMSVDDSFVAIRNELVRDGRWDNTLFVIASDNGMAYGAHRLQLEKRAPYTTQIPFMVSWPDGLGTQPRSIDTRLQNIDFAPTVCELAGCTLGPFPRGPAKPDGVSFANLLLGTGPAPDRDAVLSGFPERGAPIPQWDGVTTTPDSPLAGEGCAAAAAGGCIWHYVRYETGEKELYDDSGGPCWSWSRIQPGDPCELSNLAGNPLYADIQAALDQRLDQLLGAAPP